MAAAGLTDRQSTERVVLLRDGIAYEKAAEKAAEERAQPPAAERAPAESAAEEKADKEGSALVASLCW